MDDPALWKDVSNTQAHRIQMLREAEAYVAQLSGLKTEVMDCNFKFVHDKNDDTVGIQFTITVVFLEENENG